MSIENRIVIKIIVYQQKKEEKKKKMRMWDNGFVVVFYTATKQFEEQE